MVISIAGNKELKAVIRDSLDLFNLKMLLFNFLTKIYQEKSLKKLNKIANNTKKEIKSVEEKKKVLFNIVNGSYDLEIYRYGAIAKSLQFRGHSVEIMGCNHGLELCTAYFRIGHPPNNWTCKNCSDYFKSFCKIVKLPYSTFTDYLTNEELKKIQKKIDTLTIEECEKLNYKTVNVGMHASLSAKRYFKGIIAKKEEYEPILRLELKAAMTAALIAEKKYKKNKPDVVISGSVYSPWATVSDYFRNQGIRVCHNNLGYLPQTLNVSDSESSFGDFKKYYKEVRRKKPLNEKEKQELYSFLTKRKSGEEGGGDTYLFGFKENFKKLNEYFETSKYDKTYALFPNVPWDASLTGANKAFKDVYEWISYTIDLFEKNQNLQLIVKIHPGEKLSESENTISDFIARKYKNLSDNVTILPPDTKISPYNLFSIIDAGIVYNGTPGIEMSLEGKPSIITGITHYRGLGFTNDVSTKKEYDEYIVKSKLKKPDTNLAEIYLYFFFIKTYVPINYVYFNNFTDLGWRIKSLDSFYPGSNKYLDKICDYIIYDGIFQDW